MYFCVCTGMYSCTWTSWIYLLWVTGFGKHLIFEFALTCVFWRWNEPVWCVRSSYGPVKRWFGSGGKCDGSRSFGWTVSWAFHVPCSVRAGSADALLYRKPSSCFLAVFPRPWAQAACGGIRTPHASSVWWGRTLSVGFAWWFLTVNTSLWAGLKDTKSHELVLAGINQNDAYYAVNV